MTIRWLPLAGAVALFVPANAGDVVLHGAEPQASVAVAEAAAPHRAVLQQYCFSCHNDRACTGGLALDMLDLTQVGDHPEVWEQVVRKLRTGAMPPAGRRRPDKGVMNIGGEN